MGSAVKDNQITIIHFNDVYNVESQAKEPIGGAARFLTAVNSFSHLNPLVLFSGDAFSPCLLSSVTKGEQMIPVLNSLKTDCALLGNHEFDFGVHILTGLLKKTNFPWLMSNIIDHETNLPLGGGLVSHTIERNNKKIGLMGLVEYDWMATLATVHPEAITYTDYVEAGNALAKTLRNDGCDLVVAMTHMRFPNDIRFAENAVGIDIILGGHDHVYDTKDINGIQIVKSGTDFRDFSAITVTFPEKSNVDQKPTFAIERVSITAKFDEDKPLKAELDKFEEMLGSSMNVALAEFAADLDGRFSTVRTQESNLGNFICDVMIATTNADCAILNGGTLRSDRINVAGPFTRGDLKAILPFETNLMVLKITGAQLVEALENGVSKYPSLEGRFPQVSGIEFAFDPTKPEGKRIDPKFVIVGDQYMEEHHEYRLVTSKFLAGGHDGYNLFEKLEVLLEEDACLELSIAIQNHFGAIEARKDEDKPLSRHYQSLVTVSRRHSHFKASETGEGEYGQLDNHAHHRPTTAIHGDIVEHLENKACKLDPEIEDRIVCITDQAVLDDLIKERAEWEANKSGN